MKKLSDLTRVVREMLAESPVHQEGRHKGKPTLSYSEALPQLQRGGIKDAQDRSLSDLPELSDQLRSLYEKNELKDPSDLCRSADLRSYEEAEAEIIKAGDTATKTRVTRALKWKAKKATKATDEREWREDILKALKPAARKKVEQELALRSVYFMQQNAFNVVKYKWCLDKPKSTSRKPIPLRKVSKTAKVSIGSNMTLDETIACAEKLGGKSGIDKEIGQLEGDIEYTQEQIKKLKGLRNSLERLKAVA